jgi:phenylacetate-coenzyme A ligase PaaK-like adenylate-forming protein
VAEIARAQAVVTRPENRDQLTLRVVLSDESADREALTKKLGAAVQSACRVKVDQVEFIPADALGEDAKVILDERSWE